MRVFLLCGLILSLTILSLTADEFTVAGSIVTPESGTVYVALIPEEGFRRRIERSLAELEPAAAGERVDFAFQDVPEGNYAILAWQDTSGNGRMSWRLSGWEPWGAHRDARPFLRRPRFHELGFLVAADILDISITLR